MFVAALHSPVLFCFLVSELCSFYSPQTGSVICRLKQEPFINTRICYLPLIRHDKPPETAWHSTVWARVWERTDYQVQLDNHGDSHMGTMPQTPQTGPSLPPASRFAVASHWGWCLAAKNPAVQFLITSPRGSALLHLSIRYLGK